MKLSKNKLLKQFTQKEEAIFTAIENLQDFLDSTEDEDLSSMGAEISDIVIDFLTSNDSMNLNEIRRFIEEDFDPS